MRGSAEAVEKMRIRCEQCGLDMEVPADSVGRKLKCPGCKLVFVCRLPRAIVVDDASLAADDDLVLLDEVIDEPIAPLEALAAEPAEPSPPPAPQASADEALAEMSQAAPRQVTRENPRQWHVIVGGVRAVALTYPELVAKAARGDLKPKTKIYYAPEDLTISARDIPGLFAEIDAERQQQAAKSAPRRGLSQTEKDQAASAAEALGAVTAGQAPPGPPGGESQEAAGDNSEVQALADALGEIENNRD